MWIVVWVVWAAVRLRCAVASYHHMSWGWTLASHQVKTIRSPPNGLTGVPPPRTTTLALHCTIVPIHSPSQLACDAGPRHAVGRGAPQFLARRVRRLREYDKSDGGRWCHLAVRCVRPQPSASILHAVGIATRNRARIPHPTPRCTTLRRVCSQPDVTLRWSSLSRGRRSGSVCRGLRIYLGERRDG
jgi:hypothetical protein